MLEGAMKGWEDGVPNTQLAAEGARSVEPALLRVDEAAQYLSLGRSKMYERIARGELPVIRIGRSVRVPRNALEAWIQAQVNEQNGGESSGRL
jgi:excisionase family DNA binding protein